jgi:hypothetical protein
MNTEKSYTVSVKEAAAVAQALYEDRGFVSSKGYEAVIENRIPNGKILWQYFAENNKVVEVSDDHRDKAETIIGFMNTLVVKALERELSGFEKEALRITKEETISLDNRKDLYLIASLPKVYQNMEEKENWEVREADLARNSEFVGKLRTRCKFNLKIENIRKLRNGSSLFCCSEADQNLVKFFYDRAYDVSEGETVTVVGFVKSQEVSAYSKGKETMLNRVAISREGK